MVVCAWTNSKAMATIVPQYDKAVCRFYCTHNKEHTLASYYYIFTALSRICTQMLQLGVRFRFTRLNLLGLCIDQIHLHVYSIRLHVDITYLGKAVVEK